MPHWKMASVLVVLAVLSALGGLVPVLGHRCEHFLHDGWSVSPALEGLEEQAHHSHNVALLISLFAVAIGGGLGFFVYTRQRASLRAFVEGPGRALHSVVLEKFYVDELYDLLIVR